MQIKQVGETKQKNIYCIKDRKIYLIKRFHYLYLIQ
jgi:hypothetical protein